MENLFDDEREIVVADKSKTFTISDIITVQTIICVIIAIIVLVLNIVNENFVCTLIEEFTGNICCEQDIGSVGNVDVQAVSDDYTD